MSDKLVRRLGSEKTYYFKNNFDKVVDKYRQIANTNGYDKELIFSKERGRVIIFVKI